MGTLRLNFNRRSRYSPFLLNQTSKRYFRKDLHAFTDIIREKALEHKYTVMMGRTHGVHAEPTTFGLKLALWYQEMQRNLVAL